MRVRHLCRRESNASGFLRELRKDLLAQRMAHLTTLCPIVVRSRSQVPSRDCDFSPRLGGVCVGDEGVRRVSVGC